VDYQVGLFNGATGTLVGLEYEHPVPSSALVRTYAQVLRCDPLPRVPIALVQFDSIDHKAPGENGAHTCDTPLGSNIIPVFPTTTTFKIGTCNVLRTQLPLQPARASTIHKAQGRTVTELVYGPQTPFGPGQAYTALSRVDNIANMHYGRIRPPTTGLNSSI